MDTDSNALSGPLLEVKDLRTWFFTRSGTGKAVDGVSFTLNEGESLGLLGESGCGKSITSLSLLRLVPRPAGRIVAGEVLFQGRDLLKISEQEMRRVRGKQIAMILQDPLSTLNPVFSIGNQVAEPLRVHGIVPRSGIWERVAKLLSLVRIPAPESRLKDYPHQFSGGMRQRVVGATAISAGPKILIADEPTTSLDVTIQAQYLRLLKELQRESNLSIIYITHDLGTLARICGPGGGHVRRQDRGKAHRGGALRSAGPPLYPSVVAIHPAGWTRRFTALHPLKGVPPSSTICPPAAPLRRAVPRPRTSAGGSTRRRPASTRATAWPAGCM